MHRRSRFTPLTLPGKIDRLGCPDSAQIDARRSDGRMTEQVTHGCEWCTFCDQISSKSVTQGMRMYPMFNLGTGREALVSSFNRSTTPFDGF